MMIAHDRISYSFWVNKPSQDCQGGYESQITKNYCLNINTFFALSDFVAEESAFLVLVST